MGCNCKKKNNEPQPTNGQTVVVTTDQTQTNQPTQETQDQVIQVAAVLREMIEKKVL